MYWVAEYINNKTISEKDFSFKAIDKDNLKYLYFVNNDDTLIGINLLNGVFFIGKAQYDFKIGNGPYFPLQFKQAQVKLKLDGTQTINTVYNVGCYKFEGKFKFKYFLTISDSSIYMNAIKEDDTGKEIANRNIKIQ